MNALQWLTVRLFDAVFHDLPPLPVLERRDVENMTPEEMAEYRARLKERLRLETRRQQAELALEEKNVARRKGGAS